ncbi:hypothetical protein CLOM_g8045 [Closterium sp. NIES-68]|nr:hypothetical protein CLOM_g8045 [Closterium sp. NIES-68]
MGAHGRLIWSITTSQGGGPIHSEPCLLLPPTDTATTPLNLLPPAPPLSVPLPLKDEASLGLQRSFGEVSLGPEPAQGGEASPVLQRVFREASPVLQRGLREVLLVHQWSTREALLVPAPMHLLITSSTIDVVPPTSITITTIPAITSLSLNFYGRIRARNWAISQYRHYQIGSSHLV